MKVVTTSTLVLFFLISPTVFGNLFSLEYNDAHAKKYSEKATLILDASVTVVKKEYQDRDGFRVNDDAVIKSATMDAEKEVFGGEAVSSIRYLVRFTGSNVIKGSEESVVELRWAFQNSATASCPHYPRDLLTGKRYRFYIQKVDKDRVVGINLLETPSEK